MGLDETDTREAFDPEEAAIMLDRLASELIYAKTRNPQALSGLRSDAWQLLLCAAAWLSPAVDPDQPTLVAECAASEVEPLELARTLRLVADHLFLLAEADEGHGDSDRERSHER